MAAVSEVSDNDSGVASPEATPEGQTPPLKKLSNGTTTSSASEKVITNSKDEKSELSNSKLDLSPEKNEKTVSVISHETMPNVQENNDDDDEDLDESLAERLWGLTEMLPDSLRSATSTLSTTTVSLIKSTYQLSRQVVWIGVSMSILLFAPVMFEVERFNVEEMVKQDRNRLVLGPGSAMSGTPGLPPPPTR